MIGQTISHYKISAKLGAGGMGEVYLATDTSLDREVALKFLPEFLRNDPEARARLIREAKAASKLHHPNILTIYAVEEDQGRDFIVMEYVEGTPLTGSSHDAQRSLPVLLDIAIAVADGLQKAHSAGVIHRDIKPANILIDKDGHPRILDFGLAKVHGADKLTKTGSTTGTAAYMSPEQAQGREIDARSDLFSFGVVLYEMIAGRPPFVGEHQAALAYAIVNETPEPLSRYKSDVPPELERIIAKALAKSVEERYQSAADLNADLRALRRHGTDAPFESAAATPSLAVLPFINMSADPENEYFSDGLSEELLNALSRIDGLRVVSRTSAFKFKGQNEDIRRIGELLNVQHVVEGSVRRSGQHLRVTAQLINIADGFHLWSGRFDREMDDIFVVQDEISKTIADSLKVRLTGEQSEKLVKPSTESMEAYHIYLKGRFYWNRRTRDGIAKGIQLFTQAITLDPNYALAHVGLADAYNLLSVYANVPPHDAFPKGKAAASRALEIDPTLAEAHTSLAFARCWYDWDWPEAERGFRKAIELNPNYALAHYWYSICLMAVRRLGEAEAMVRHALDRDPLSIIINASLGWILHGSGRHDEAIEQFIKTIDMDPTFARTRWSLGLAYAERGLFDEAIEELRQGVLYSAGSTYVLAALGHVYGRAGRFAEAREVLDQMTDLAGKQYVSPADFALVYAGLNDLERAIDALEKALADRSSDVLLWARSSRVFELLEHDPRYGAAMKKMGLLP